MLVLTSGSLVYRIVRPARWLREHLVGILGSGVLIHGAVVWAHRRFDASPREARWTAPPATLVTQLRRVVLAPELRGALRSS